MQVKDLLRHRRTNGLNQPGQDTSFILTFKNAVYPEMLVDVLCPTRCVDAKHFGMFVADGWKTLSLRPVLIVHIFQARISTDAIRKLNPDSHWLTLMQKLRSRIYEDEGYFHERRIKEVTPFVCVLAFQSVHPSFNFR